MKRRQFFQTTSSYFLIPLLFILLSITACASGAAESVQSPAIEATAQVAEQARAEEAQFLAEAEFDAAAESAGQVVAEDRGGETAAAESNISPASNLPDVYNRLIIKNAEVELMVEDTDTTINRALGIVTEYRGYVVSNRTWFSGELKYATLSIGVPAENFEEMLRRLKDLAVSVTNETVSGQDVTDEFVDLESRLRNLEATADRIRDFLDKATDVEESLRVSNQLGEIEAQIEQVKGRMAYLKDRAAFSTITLQLSPQPPTPTPTPSPTPTPTPVPWNVNRTIDQATGVTSSVATTLFQVSVELLVWFVIVILPFLLPIAGLIWLTTRVLRRVGVDKALGPPSS